MASLRYNYHPLELSGTRSVCTTGCWKWVALALLATIILIALYIYFEPAANRLEFDEENDESGKKLG